MQDPFGNEEKVKAAVVLYGRDIPRTDPSLDHLRVNGRGFPTGYPAQSWQMVNLYGWEKSIYRELDLPSGFWGIRKRARHASRSDRRVLIGPSQADIDVIGVEILHGWCFARAMCQNLGIYSGDPLRMNPPVREGLVLDYLTRRNASALGAGRGVVSSEREAAERYGIDVIRISIDHGVLPDALAPYLSRLGLASF